MRCPTTEANTPPVGSAASTPARQERYVALADDLVVRPVRDLLARRGGGPELPASKDGRRWRDVTSTGHLANDVGARRVHGEDEPRHALSGTYITTESPSQISRPGTITTGGGITHRPRMLIDRSRVTTDETSGIVNDPNDWCKAHNNPRSVVHLTSSSRPSAWNGGNDEGLPELDLSSGACRRPRCGRATSR